MAKPTFLPLVRSPDARIVRDPIMIPWRTNLMKLSRDTILITSGGSDIRRIGSVLMECRDLTDRNNGAIAREMIE